MVTCQSCHQALPPGRADQRFCSGRCRMRHHRAQKDPQHATRQWRQQMDFELPVFFRPSDEHQVPLVEGRYCSIPRHYFNPELGTLNALYSLAVVLAQFNDFQGCIGQTNLSDDWDHWEGDDWGSAMLTKHYEMQRKLEQLRKSEGRLGQLLRAHWPLLEQGLLTVRRHVQRFVLSHQSEAPYEVDLSAAFQAHIREWGIELSLLWLDLEAQSR